VFIGKSPQRTFPGFFFKKITAPIHTFDSPNFIVDKSSKSIRIGPTILYNTRKILTFLKSIRLLHNKIKEHQPDRIINFYDMVGGLYYLFHAPKIPLICIAHQYYLAHPSFEFPEGNTIDKWFLKIHNRITSFGASKKLALSFTEEDDVAKKRLYIVPPLIRKEVLQLKPVDEGLLLAYILNKGYSQEIIDWHKQHPATEIHFFGDTEEDQHLAENLVWHKIDDEAFLYYMKRCKGFAATAGFESICEAMYLKKPVMMIPTGGHFEQKCNAHDAAKAGAGIIATHFDFSRLLDYIPYYNAQSNTFTHWVKQSSSLILQRLTE
jgi:uncharacterized protein (TIGR00661 family)